MIYKIMIGLLFLGCASNQDAINRNKREKLNFGKCVIAANDYEYLVVDMPKGYKKTNQTNEGMCEYRFSYEDGSTAYITNNIWFYSSLNYENIESSGQSTYPRDSLLQNITLNGSQADATFWSETITDGFKTGYVNATEAKKEKLERAFEGIRKE